MPPPVTSGLSFFAIFPQRRVRRTHLSRARAPKRHPAQAAPAVGVAHPITAYPQAPPAQAQNGRRAGRPDGCALPRRSGSVAKSRIRRASGRKRRAPHRAGRRKRPQNDFAESPKASANGKNVFSFRKPAPPRGKAATAYGIRSRANAIPQARTAPVMKRLCRARRAALRRTQIGRRECFIGKPYAAGQHKRLFENAAHWHACHLRVRRMQRPTEAGRLVRALDYRL